jgi:hypothetical protein
VGNILRVEDSDGRPMESHLLQAGDDPDAIARSLLRAKKKSEQFFSPIDYRPNWVV